MLLEGGVLDPTVISSVFTSAMANSVLAQITSLMPVVLPAIIGFIAFRKGLAFIKSALKSA